MASPGEPWAQLICSTNNDTDPIYISKDIFVIGRAKDCDLKITDNKLLSGKHCYIQRLSGGQVILHDTSTNGTLLNSKTKILKTGELLQHGDEFHVVYKKGAEESNLGYLFQDLEELRKEAADDTQEYDISELDQTVSDEIDCPEDMTPEGPKKRPAPESLVGKPSLKRIRSGDEGENAVRTSQKAGPSGAKCDILVEKVPETAKEGSKEELEKELVPERKTEETKEGETETDVKDDTCEKSVMKSDSDKTKAADCEEEDAMMETLMCIICQEILHDCISLQPCMHSFCSGCYSDWMKMSNECPSCRVKVDRINKNHIVNNLVEAYLKTNPDKKRPEEDIKELNEKNTITRDMLYPKGRRYSDNSDGSGGDDDDDDDDDGPRMPMLNPLGLFAAPVLGGIRMFGAPPPPMNVCRQCPNYHAPVPNPPGAAVVAVPPVPGAAPALATGGPTATAANVGPAAAPDTPGDDAVPSTSGATGDNGRRDGATGGPRLKDEKVVPTPPNYVCHNNQNHAICLCCMQPMPDRRTDRVTDPTLPVQQCSICYRFYCHAYWGCTKGDCLGCIGRFRDMNFGKKGLAGLINDNAYESNVLKDYLESEEKSVRDMLQECVAKMERGTYTTVDSGRNHLNGDTATCYACGIRNFKELAYQYRRDIPASQLPAEVTRRADCYWGKNCRTQKNKPHHAQRFNHICDQLRTT
ncbi:E3 ubiquitin-protein ligase CHFR-like isoform X2 [Lineus longissimus]|uniref:E3 ubiquitin-protein ligase CHFR-like isoform X2 n=1 Tax=Lineus longissimus TaxID=88925 RepID=UPI00315C9322